MLRPNIVCTLSGIAGSVEAGSVAGAAVMGAPRGVVMSGACAPATAARSWARCGLELVTSGEGAAAGSPGRPNGVTGAGVAEDGAAGVVPPKTAPSPGVA